MEIKSTMPALTALQGAQGGLTTGGVAGQKSGGVQFTDALNNALQSVSNTQAETDQLQQRFQMGDDSVSLESTMISMQKSQLAFQGAVTVRNRLVSAYTDIMNMSV